jgi:hypothetical protein
LPHDAMAHHQVISRVLYFSICCLNESLVVNCVFCWIINIIVRATTRLAVPRRELHWIYLLYNVKEERRRYSPEWKDLHKTAVICLQTSKLWL